MSWAKVKRKMIIFFYENPRLTEQTDGWLWGRTVSVIVWEICLCKMREDVEVPAKEIFSTRYINDVYIRRKISIRIISKFKLLPKWMWKKNLKMLLKSIISAPLLIMLPKFFSVH